MGFKQNGLGKCGLGLIWMLVLACHDNHREAPKQREIVEQPAALSERTSDNIRIALAYAEDNHGLINDSIQLNHLDVLKDWYENRSFTPVWVHPPSWAPVADSLYEFIQNGMYSGLFPADYNGRSLHSIQDRLRRNTFDEKDAVLWSLGDLILTDAFIGMTHDLAFGRIPRDSTTLRKDSVFTKEQYEGFLHQVLDSGQSISAFFKGKEPGLRGYLELKEALGAFLDTARFQHFTPVEYPAHPSQDSLVFLQHLLARFKEEKLVADSVNTYDSLKWAQAVKVVQKAKGLKADGRPGPLLVNALNRTDEEKFRITALNMDRYKLLPDSEAMPKEFVWVNLPGFYLQVWNDDSLQFQSRVIVGHPETRTPELSSRLSNFITYPVWTVPESIIYKEMLPKIQRSTAYLTAQNLVVVNDRDSILDPSKLPWHKYHKDNFPYRIRQLEGNDNSLGVIKFNFANKYSVYLHDTNERDLFASAKRDLSHGCVRVQDWKKLAAYLVRNDSIRYPVDTIKAWIARSAKHTVYFKDRIPLYLRYYTCDGKDGRLTFYDDIYGEDKYLLTKYFTRPVR
jgi:murein L,D-transpeptidase YcbB/YkuD